VEEEEEEESSRRVGPGVHVVTWKQEWRNEFELSRGGGIGYCQLGWLGARVS